MAAQNWKLCVLLREEKCFLSTQPVIKLRDDVELSKLQPPSPASPINKPAIVFIVILLVLSDYWNFPARGLCLLMINY